MDRLISYVVTVLVMAFGLPLLLLGTAPAFGGLDYNPEFDALAAPIGLFLIYFALYNLRLTHPRMPWPGTPGFSQGCLVSWIGFFALSTILSALGALLGRRSFDLASFAFVWGLFVALPFGLAWIVRRIRHTQDDGRAFQ